MVSKEELNILLLENRRMRRALEDIRNWNLPLIEGQSYEVMMGSNGARDYMRKIAKQALESIDA